ncbi:unnamed protein product, partial [Iphiclides podalirius]
MGCSMSPGLPGTRGINVVIASYGRLIYPPGATHVHVPRAVAALLRQQHRRSHTPVETLGTMIQKQPHYSTMTDMEAYGVRAEAVLLRACLCILDGKDLASLLRVTLKVNPARRNTYNSPHTDLRDPHLTTLKGPRERNAATAATGGAAMGPSPANK